MEKEEDALRKEYMQRAIVLAKRGTGWVSPNPLVGAVLVKEGRIIGEGWHKRYGGLHAEREAIKSCEESPAGADLYVTLEPCCHQGKQPPCTEAIAEAGIQKVYVGSADPNPLVAGKGIAYLRERGIQVYTDVEKEACDRLNPIFFHYIRKKTPYVCMKYAMTMDGKIASVTGDARWVSGEESRKRVQADRHRFRGIMVGIETVLQDDPSLTCRMPGGRNPVRIVCDTHLRTPLTSTLVQTADRVPTILATSRETEARWEKYRERGVEILPTEMTEGRLDLSQLMAQLGARQIDSILLEGGGTLNWSMLSRGLVQGVQAYIAPKIIGGATAGTPVRGAGFERMQDALRLTNICWERIGEDLLMEGEIACLQD